MTRDKRVDQEIDRIVDEIVEDEKTADALKDKLHHSFDASDTTYGRPEANTTDDGDMWDNMPV
ncbi:hypothetical protein [Celeribacter litoreus]|uniref:hypothetical protein n=1 Tax=Celeribacter litoreus TaxID=2876714 RepID=UPI001CC9C86A|nr:hypothetical protein [Celeribacter litoreus]MCA0043550.1 hypothetical protein [Celeribacter litoreus]